MQPVHEFKMYLAKGLPFSPRTSHSTLPAAPFFIFRISRNFQHFSNGEKLNNALDKFLFYSSWFRWGFDVRFYDFLSIICRLLDCVLGSIIRRLLESYILNR